MKYQGPQSMGEALMAYLRESQLDTPILEHRVVELWPQLMGETVAQLTRKVEVKQGVLYIRLYSAALRQQLFDCRHELVTKINQTVGAQVIHDVRV